MAAARFLVRGKVQGVFFRASTRDAATRWGLDGIARNLDDGGVEVIAAGDAAALEQLARWLQHGPPMAHVESVQQFEWNEPTSPGFTIA
ncbi:acylphosphatase [Pseudoxanthomonas indica]|uniref:acylphosphatase n=1 Tax=Pseudoxanthomonas indica TaxID=428993 RepID=A0A1T5JMP7_9GAMM|nr:acylphosphatase [Pseudoxanthomonas indica]GGD43251.1 acylphosphatase [Pseudoxanthomonas indica]SKC52720.1 acylphosphatase [Pseudoxanthomonas indica]